MRSRPGFVLAEPQLSAAALTWIGRHGAYADIEAAMRADEMMAEGEIEGAAAWRAILRRINGLASPPPA
jgi:hypothetical protein